MSKSKKKLRKSMEKLTATLILVEKAIRDASEPEFMLVEAPEDIDRSVN